MIEWREAQHITRLKSLRTFESHNRKPGEIAVALTELTQIRDVAGVRKLLEARITEEDHIPGEAYDSRWLRAARFLNYQARVADLGHPRIEEETKIGPVGSFMKEIFSKDTQATVGK